MEQITAAARETGSVSYLDFFTKAGLKKRFAIACYLNVAQQLTGVNYVINFQAEIFKKCGYESVELQNSLIPLGPNMIFQLVGVVGVVCSLLLMDSKFGGRRSLLLKATPLMVVSMLALSVSFLMEVAAGENNRPTTAGYLLMWTVNLYWFGFQLSWGPVPWLYPAEIFSDAERERGCSMAAVAQFVGGILVNLVATSIQNHSSLGWVLMLFSGLCASNQLFVFTSIKETKGVPLDEVQCLFDGKPVDTKTAPLV